jgi:ADP-ribose pyrophosphatase YjhB (NUDIX family)
MMHTDPQLQQLRFCSRCGAELGQREAYGRLRAACPACGFVVFVAPKVSCGVVVERAGHVLLVQRRHEPGRGRWGLPCGFAEAEEPPEQAAQREAFEETGLVVTIGALLGAYHYTDDPRGAGIMLVYRATAMGDPMSSDETDAAGFFGPEALPPLSHATHRRALRDFWGETVPLCEGEL